MSWLTRALRPSTWRAPAPVEGGPGPVPLVIGVTGHRDLRPEDIAPLRAAVRSLLDGLRRDYPSTPIVALSSLAAGADCLVARVVLEAGGGLVVPLPMPRSEYEKDFVDAAALEEFRALLGHAETWFELPILAGSSEAAISTPGPARDRQYELGGAYVALNSQILLALWDGRDSDLVGGTAAVVRFKLKGTYGVLGVDGGPLDVPDNGPVYQIETPRLKHHQPAAPTFAVRKLFPERFASVPGLADQLHDDKLYEGVYSLIDRFNRDASGLGPELVDQLRTSRESLYPSSPDQPLSPALARVRDGFAMADVLALHFQRRTDGHLLKIFWIIFVAVAFFDSYTHHLLASPLAFGLAVVLILLARGSWKRMRSGDLQNKHQDYRTLAEGLRVLFFWRLSGIRDSVAENYLRKQRSEIDWIRDTIRSIHWPKCGEKAGEALATPEPPADLATVQRCWIESQVSYFHRSQARDHHREHVLHRWSRIALGLNLVALALVSALLAVVALADPLAAAIPAAADAIAAITRSEEYLKPWLVVVVGLASVGAALLHNRAEKRAYAEHVRQFRRMFTTFTRGATEFDRCLAAGDRAGAEALLRDLGREALAEHGDWLLLHRDRPWEVPEEGLRYSSFLTGMK